MIDYQTYCRIRLFRLERGLGFSRIGSELGIDPETAAKYAALPAYPRRRAPRRASKLDAFKPAIVRWLEHHPYSVTRIHQHLRAEEGYTGGLSIVKDYVRAVRPVRRPAFLSLAFAPGEAAQVDWGSAGVIQIGATRRRLSFFVMVLGHSRMAYVAFTCGEATEHFLACHQNALEFFGGTPGVILIDNLKTGVLSHRFGQRAVFNPRYLDFAAHHGFEPRACAVRRANEKGRVENFVGYVKKNLLAFPDRLCLYHAHNLVATHPRSYERHRDFEDPDHVRELLDDVPTIQQTRMKADPAVLDTRLATLRLPFVREHCQPLAAAVAKNSIAHLDYLAQLIEGEANLRADRTVARRIHSARFPAVPSS